jgi:hypothetical protein
MPKKNLTKLFSITQLKRENIKAYLKKKINKEMLNVENLLKPMTIKSLDQYSTQLLQMRTFLHTT